MFEYSYEGCGDQQHKDSPDHHEKKWKCDDPKDDL